MGIFGNKKKCACSPMMDVLMSEGTKNSANALFANIRFAAEGGPLRSVAVTSSVPGEGQSTVAVALAAAAGASGRSCLLVEADMRRRSLAGALGVNPSRGLYALLSEECSVEEAVAQTSFENVAFLGAEPGAPTPESILGSERFDQLMASLAEHFDYVVYSTPPLQAFPDGTVVANKADATVLVLRQDYTGREDAARSVEALQAAHAKLHGTVVTWARP